MDAIEEDNGSARSEGFGSRSSAKLWAFYHRIRNAWYRPQRGTEPELDFYDLGPCRYQEPELKLSPERPYQEGRRWRARQTIGRRAIRCNDARLR
jgi:hypothetical protein